MDPNPPPASRSRLQRRPQQERSQARFESILTTAMRLFAEQGYEAVSMREIARATELPIASLYMYFPTKLSIVREIWSRYATTVAGELEASLLRLTSGPADHDIGTLIAEMIDLMAELQGQTPVYLEIWGVVEASPELRALNVEDTLRVMAIIGSTLRRLEPRLGKTEAESLALVLSEAANSATKVALSLPPAARRRTLKALKDTMLLIYRGVMAEVARR
jgi:AcrR family transcriptional regulator